ncbi:MAG: TIGR00730 family Rossman fold protein [Hyphomicrobiaceae bacterium]
MPHPTATQQETSVPAREFALEARSVCVFCGSGPGKSPAYVQAARHLGRTLAESGRRLVYGGGGLGLMGEVARAALGHSGLVTGIIPEFLSRKEHLLRDVDKVIITRDMHERKRLMFEHSDAFVALPGGIGTLEELIEQLTWSQLGQHDKPIVLANIEKFWDPLLALLEHMKQEAFIRSGLEVRFIVVPSAAEILPAIDAAIARGAGRHVSDKLPERF